MNVGTLGTPSSSAQGSATYVEYGPFAITSPGVIYVANPFGRDVVVNVILQNFIAEKGYVPGDRALQFGGAFAATGGGFGIRIGRNQCLINVPGTLRIYNKTGGTNATITAANWRLVIGLVG